MFPKYLDNATVIEYTPKGEYGFVDMVEYGEIVETEQIVYYAIAKYNNDNRLYSFGCNELFEVISDFVWDNIDELKRGLLVMLGQNLIWKQI